MAFCTQRKFPGQCYEHNELAEINKMKCYSSIKDHRAWSIDQNQQASYLVDAVHQGEGDRLNSQHILSNGLLRSKNEIEKPSKRVGPSHNIDTPTSVGTKQNDSLKMFELTMELEATKLNNTNLTHEIDDLKERIANIRSSEQQDDENIQNHFNIIENLVSERNDLRELLDKFLGVTDQIIELKIQADQMKNIESEYILLQTKFREHQTELETLRREKQTFEQRIGNLQSDSQETHSLKETNSKLEKDLYELSGMISVSDNFIHDQQKEMDSKLQKITQLNKQIENLKAALSEAELKLNKKLRLEMDVELMEKELSIMIENSAESNPYNQQVIDRQVEDLATAIKLTLGYMNYELENDEEENLVEANRQLKTLLLESSNKILEFKDVINKQEQNLMKVTNDFVCKNDELTECLATVEELKTQLAKRPTIKNYSNTHTDLTNADNTLNTCVNDVTDEGINEEHEIFENEINLADSQQISDYESDGREIEDLENIFEKSCGQQGSGADDHLTSVQPNLAESEKLGDLKRDPKQLVTDVKGVFPNQHMSKVSKDEQRNLNTSNQNLKTDAASCSADVLSRLSDKIEHMSSYINDLESKNKELKTQNVKLFQQKNDSITGNEKEKYNEPDNERDICEVSDAVPHIYVTEEFQNLQLRLNDMNAEIDKLQKANEELKGTIQSLQRPINFKKSSSKSKSQLFNETDPEKCSIRKSESTDMKEIRNENEKLKLENENLIAEIDKLKTAEKQAQTKDLEKLTAISEFFAGKNVQDLDGVPPDLHELIVKYGDLKKANDLEKSSRAIPKSESVAKSDLGEEKVDDEVLPHSKAIADEIEKLQSENNKLRKANEELKETIQMMKQPKRSTSKTKSQSSEKHRPKLSSKPQQLETELKKIEKENKHKSPNDKLVAELKDSENCAHMATLENDLKNLKAVNEQLLLELNNLKSQRDPPKYMQELDGMPPDTKDLILQNEELRNVNEQLLLKIKYLEGVDKTSDDLERKNEFENLSEKIIKTSELRKSTSTATGSSSSSGSGSSSSSGSGSSGEISEKISETPDDENKTKFDSLPNGELLAEIRKLQSENCKLQKALADLSSKSTKHLPSQTNRDKISTKSEQLTTDWITTDIKQIENENEQIKMENEKLVVEMGELKNSENQARMNILEMEKELAKLSSLNENLLAELSNKMPPDLQALILKNDELRSANEQLSLKASYLESIDQRTRSPDDATRAHDFLKGTNESNKSTSTTGSVLCDDLLDQIVSKFPSNVNLVQLVAEIESLQQSTQTSSTTIRQMENDLKKLRDLNDSLLEQLNVKDTEMKQDASSADVHRQNEELKILNENLLAEINELKNSENVAQSSAVEMKNELDNLTAANKMLLEEINELKQRTSDNSKIESNWMAADTKKMLKKTDEALKSETGEPKSPENRSNSSILQIGRDLEKLAALNESMLAFTESDMDRKPSSMAPDITKLLNKNQELKKTNENLSAKIKELQSSENRAHLDANESQNKLEALEAANESLLARINELEHFSSTDMQILKNENEKFKSLNESLQAQTRLLEQKLQNINSRTEAYFKTSSSADSKQLSTEKPPLVPRSNDYNMEIDWMVSDMKKLQSKNESLKAANEKLLSQISDLQVANRSNLRESEIRNESDKMLTMKESDNQLMFASNRNIEIDWMKADMDVLKNKNGKLKTANESLIAEIGLLKSAETRAHKNTQQMEKDLLKLSAINERLSAQLNDKKQLSKARVVDGETNDPKDLLKKIDDLTSTNESLVLEITELKSLDTIKMRNDIKKLSSTNESLKLQINELQLMSANELKMESNWMATDMKKVLSKNKKLNISNQNLSNENTELRREFKSMENRANLNALQKLKELERLTAINENLTAQLNYHKERMHSKEAGLDAVATDVKKFQKKNEELKAANEKLLSVIKNLKSTEKLATSKANELEKELNKLQDSHKYLQDTLENYVEKDWNKPKTELERICQLILNDGIGSLTDSEYTYMCKWFGKSMSGEYDMPKSSRPKNTTRKHCRICHQALDTWDKICDCKQYEEKKRLHLLKEIEQTKLAIQHIQSSSDIEFDLNDVKNRLLKGKPPDQSDIERQYELQLSESQQSVNVRAHIINKPGKSGNHMRK